MDASSRRAAISAATFGNSMDARARGPRFRSSALGNSGNWRPRWRMSSGDRGDQLPVQQQCSPGQRRWSRGSADQQPPGTANTPPPRRCGCYVCGHPRCHSDFHREDALSPQAPPAMGCFVCDQRGCPSSRHEGNMKGLPAPSAPSQPVSPASGPATGTVNPPSNWQWGSRHGERARPANVPSRPQTN